MINSNKNIINGFEFPAINKVFVYFTCFYVFIWYVQLGTRIDIFRQTRFEFLLGALLSAISIVYISSSVDKPSDLSKYVKLFYLVLIIQIPFSYDFDASLNYFIDRVVKFSLLALFISSAIKSPKSLKLLMLFFLLAWFKLGQESFLGWFSGSLVWQNQH